MKRNYWWCVGAGAVVLVLTGATIGSGSRVSGGTEELSAAISQSSVSATLILGSLITILGAGSLIAAAISVFLRNPILVGIKRFFLKNAREPVTLKEVRYSFRNDHYL